MTTFQEDSDTPANVKAKLTKAVVSINSPDPRNVRAELAHAEGISSLVMTGDGVHIVVDNADRRIPEFAARLEQARIRFDAMKQVAPTIEDLFVDAVASGAERHE